MLLVALLVALASVAWLLLVALLVALLVDLVDVLIVCSLLQPKYSWLDQFGCSVVEFLVGTCSS